MDKTEKLYKTIIIKSSLGALCQKENNYETDKGINKEIEKDFFQKEKEINENYNNENNENNENNDNKTIIQSLINRENKPIIKRETVKTNFYDMPKLPLKSVGKLNKLCISDNFLDFLPKNQIQIKQKKISANSSCVFNQSKIKIQKNPNIKKKELSTSFRMTKDTEKKIRPIILGEKENNNNFRKIKLKIHYKSYADNSPFPFNQKLLELTKKLKSTLFKLSPCNTLTKKNSFILNNDDSENYSHNNKMNFNYYYKDPFSEYDRKKISKSNIKNKNYNIHIEKDLLNKNCSIMNTKDKDQNKVQNQNQNQRLDTKKIKKTKIILKAININKSFHQKEKKILKSNSNYNYNYNMNLLKIFDNNNNVNGTKIIRSSKNNRLSPITPKKHTNHSIYLSQLLKDTTPYCSSCNSHNKIIEFKKKDNSRNFYDSFNYLLVDRSNDIIPIGKRNIDNDSENYRK